MNWEETPPMLSGLCFDGNCSVLHLLRCREASVKSRHSLLTPAAPRVCAAPAPWSPPGRPVPCAHLTVTGVLGQTVCLPELPLTCAACMLRSSRPTGTTLSTWSVTTGPWLTGVRGAQGPRVGVQLGLVPFPLRPGKCGSSVPFPAVSAHGGLM